MGFECQDRSESNADEQIGQTCGKNPQIEICRKLVIKGGGAKLPLDCSGKDLDGRVASEEA